MSESTVALRWVFSDHDDKKIKTKTNEPNPQQHNNRQFEPAVGRRRHPKRPELGRFRSTHHQRWDVDIVDSGQRRRQRHLAPPGWQRRPRVPTSPSPQHYGPFPLTSPPFTPLLLRWLGLTWSIQLRVRVRAVGGGADKADRGAMVGLSSGP